MTAATGPVSLHDLSEQAPGSFSSRSVLGSSRTLPGSWSGEAKEMRGGKPSTSVGARVQLEAR
eukprot:6817679-Lingulodinium_polyedra.AAC.1